MLNLCFRNTLLVFLFSYFSPINACQCPLTIIGMEECNKYDLIFKGKIITLIEPKNKFGEAVFRLDELYKGNTSKEFKILFDINEVCAQKFNIGDEWIIYCKYKQINNAKIDWCSRSRKFFKIEKEDFYTTTYGNDYFAEVKFLRDQLGLHQFLKEEPSQIGNRNNIPNSNQMIIILIISLLVIVIFYYIFNKVFK